MGTAAQFARAMEKRAAQVKQSERGVVTAGATVVKAEWLRYANRDTGGDLRLSNWRGSRVMVGYDFKGNDKAVVKPRDSKGGAVVRVLEEGAGAHRIARRGRGRRRRSLKIDGWFAGRSVLHPGTRGQATFTRHLSTILSKADEAMTDDLMKLFKI